MSAMSIPFLDVRCDFMRVSSLKIGFLTYTHTHTRTAMVDRISPPASQWVTVGCSVITLHFYLAN